MRVQHRLGDSGGSGREEDDGDVRWLGGDAARADGRATQRLGQCGGSRERLGRHLDHEGRVDLSQCALHLRRAERVQQRGRDGADAPAGPSEDGGGQAVGNLPGDGLAASHALGPQAAGHGSHERLHLGGGESCCAVDNVAAVGSHDCIEHGHVPRSARPPVPPGLAGHPGGAEPHRHGRAPYPAPTNVTPMSGSSAGAAWISR